MKQRILLLLIIAGLLHSIHSVAQNTPWTTSGNIGIGTTAPLGRFHVEGGAIFGTPGGNIRILKTAATLSGDDLGIWNSTSGGSQVFNIADWNTGTQGISINTTNGNIGIGTKNPIYKLHIESSTSVGLVLRTNSSTISNPQVDYYDNARGAETVITSTDGTTNGTFIGSYSNHPMLFGTNASGGGNITKMIIQPNGNVGISTTNPLGRFHVEGGAVFGTPAGNIRVLKTAGTLAGDDLGIWNAAGGGGQVFNIADWNTGTKGISINTTSGNVGIGTTNPTEMLSVKGNVKTQKLIVTQSGWSDYVFDPIYRLKPITEVAKFIQENKRLPEVPSAKEIKEKGIDVGENQVLLLKKIEELTLYIIELDRKNERQQKQIDQLLKEKGNVKSQSIKSE
ncbi:hypothetical protein [Hydrobacter penzbergensis]|nr:hypothetical protein [Hydrobacter penzbergensis]